MSIGKGGVLFFVGLFAIVGFFMFVYADVSNSCLLSAPFSCVDSSALADLDVISLSISNMGNENLHIISLYVVGCNENNLTQGVFPDWLEVGGQDSYSIYCDSDVLVVDEAFNASILINFTLGNTTLVQTVTGVLSVVPIGSGSSSSSSSSSGSSSGSGVYAAVNTCYPNTDVRSTAAVLHRKHVSCEDDSYYELAMKGLEEQHIVINSEKRQYCNFGCINRKQEQCYRDGSFDTYYMEWCENSNGSRIALDGSDNWEDYGYECYSDVDCDYEYVCKAGLCVTGDVGDVQCTHNYDCPSGKVCENYKCVVVPVTYGCEDSDGGINLYEKGKLMRGGVLFKDSIDYCQDENHLFEYDCGWENGISESVHSGEGGASYECSYGCLDGACKKGEDLGSCYDSDGGVDYYSNGYVKDENGKQYYDYCFDKTYFTAKVIASDPTQSETVPEAKVKGVLNEYYCYVDENKKERVMSKAYTCPYGCSEGVCIKSVAMKKVISDSVGGSSEFVEGDLCTSGCNFDGKCYAFGYRKSGEYCSDIKGEFVRQKGAEEVCDNNFECDSNVCVSGQCVSQGFIQKVISWFKGIFG